MLQNMLQNTKYNARSIQEEIYDVNFELKSHF